MALNLWKLQKPTSYNPLPIGYVNNIQIKIGDYLVIIKAKSPTNARLNFDRQKEANDPYIILSNEVKTYTVDLKSSNEQLLYLYDDQSKGDIIIEDIQLVQKPLPKLTINGIDGFLSGKWTLHANARVLDDETLELNAIGTTQSFSDYFSVMPNTQYNLNISMTSGYAYLRFYDLNNVQLQITSSVSNGNLVVQSPSNAYKGRLYLESTALGTHTIKKPMLKLGTSPAPYERKKGERMVLPSVKGNMFDKNTITASRYLGSNGVLTASGVSSVSDFIKVSPSSNYYSSNLRLDGTGGLGYYDKDKNFISWNGTLSVFTTPSTCEYIRVTTNDINIAVVYNAVQLNKKPKRWVPKKNLLNNSWSQNGLSNGGVGTGSISAITSSTTRVLSDILLVNGGKSYTINVPSGFQVFIAESVDGNIINASTSWVGTHTFITQTNTRFCRMMVRKIGDLTITPTEAIALNLQLEEGTTATPYEPYQQVLPKAKSGLAFNGTTDYLQLPSMTMDSIEIDCLIDGVQPNSFQYLFDGRTGLALGWVYSSTPNLGADISTMLIDGIVKTTWNDIPKNQRTKIKIIANKSFTDDVRIFRSYADTGATKGTIYKITCYLGNQVVATYDFENPQNIVGDKVLPNAVNLIPSFDDVRWSLHANADVLGEDVLRLEPTALWQISKVKLKLNHNASYLYKVDSNYSNMAFVDSYDVSNSKTVLISAKTGIQTFTVPSNSNEIEVLVTNGGISTGTFDFIKPQLYELSGKEGTIVGKPTPLRKTSKRTLYSKR